MRLNAKTCDAKRRAAPQMQHSTILENPSLCSTLQPPIVLPLCCNDIATYRGVPPHETLDTGTTPSWTVSQRGHGGSHVAQTVHTVGTASRTLDPYLVCVLRVMSPPTGVPLGTVRSRNPALTCGFAPSRSGSVPPHPRSSRAARHLTVT
jgi:hypothetical protein